MTEADNPVKFCVRCERALIPPEPRYFRGILTNGVFQSVLEYFCEPCLTATFPEHAPHVIK